MRSPQQNEDLVLDAAFMLIWMMLIPGGAVAALQAEIVGRGPVFISPQAVAVEADGSLIVPDPGIDDNVILQVDPTTGDRSILYQL